MFRGSPAARAACWSNDLIRSALITALLVTMYGSIRVSERGREGRSEGGGSDLKRDCQFVKLSRATAYYALVFSRGVGEFAVLGIRNESADIKERR